MKERKAVLLMLLASFIWGMTFAFQSQASESIGPFMFNGIRMLLGVVVLSPMLIKALKKHTGDKKYFYNLFVGGSVSGVATAAACGIQQVGITFSTAGKAGFLTSLYTLFVPLISIAIGKKVSRKIWCCVFIGVIGAFLLSFTPGQGFGTGDFLLLGCAFMFAVQMMIIDHFVPNVEGIDFSAVQFTVSGLICLVIGLLSEDFEFSMIRGALIPILYSGICSCGIAYTIQIVCQKYVQPTKATMALCPESAWAAIGGAVILGETMNFKEISGAVLIFAAVLISQINLKKRA